MLNICLFTSTFLPQTGGAELVVHNLAQQLAEFGNSVTVIAPRYRKSLRIEGQYRVVRFKWPPRNILVDAFLQLFLLGVHFRYRFDLLHAHFAYPPGYCAVRVKKFLNIPVIVTPHGADVQVEPEIGYGIRLNPRIDRKVREALRRADAITAISTSLKNTIVDAGASEERIFLIPNGINFGAFQVREEVKVDHPFIFSMGRFVPKKGFDLLIKAFGMLARDNAELQLVIAGEGPEKDNCQRLVQNLGLEERVRLLDFVKEGRKVQLLSGCLFFVCPSRREPFGLVNLEAMAGGKPVVASNVDGIPDIVKDGENGLLFESESVGDLAYKMKILLEDEPLRKRLGVRARQMAQRYDWSRIVKQYLEVYSLCLQDRRRLNSQKEVRGAE